LAYEWREVFGWPWAVGVSKWPMGRVGMWASGPLCACVAVVLKHIRLSLEVRNEILTEILFLFYLAVSDRERVASPVRSHAAGLAAG
jgi:hypothetical protein